MFSIRNLIDELENNCGITFEFEDRYIIETKGKIERMKFLVGIQCFIIENKFNLSEEIRIHLLANAGMCMFLIFGEE